MLAHGVCVMLREASLKKFNLLRIAEEGENDLWNEMVDVQFWDAFEWDDSLACNHHIYFELLLKEH